MIFLIGFQSNHSTENKLRAVTGDWGVRLGNRNAALVLEVFLHLHFEYLLSSCSFYNYLMVEWCSAYGNSHLFMLAPNCPEVGKIK